MMTQDKETLREADKVAALTDFQLRVVALPIHEKPMAVAFEAGWDAAIATMFEHLRTPSEKALRAGCNKIDWERNPQEHMPTAPNGIVDLNSTFLTPGATTIGQDMLDAWQAMLTAFQQENSDAANN